MVLILLIAIIFQFIVYKEIRLNLMDIKKEILEIKLVILKVGLIMK